MKINLLKYRTTLLGAALLVIGFAYSQNANAQNRTVVDTEVGSIFQNPGGTFPYSEYGAFVGTPDGALAPQGILVRYGEAFELSPGTTYGQTLSNFYAGLQAYEATQVATGNPPIFVTATYQGISLPVYYGPSLALSAAGVPTAPSSNWQQAVNVSDPRYVNLWITQYAQSTLTGSEWLEIDEGAFNYSAYGVLSGDGVFVPGVTWDEPFPQNDTAYLEGIASFYNQLATYNQTAAFPIYTVTDVGSISQPALFPTVFNGAPAVLLEDLYAWYTGPSSTIRNEFYEQSFQLLPWMATQNKVAILRALLPSGQSNLLTVFVEYSLLKGMNFFFAPGNESAENTEPSLWSPYSAALGYPTGAMTSGSPSSLGSGYRLYQRNYEGGTVYLNWTGGTQTVTLRRGGPYYNPSGESVRSITIPDGVGTFVSLRPNNLPMPEISPVYSSAVNDPVTVTITSATSGATIRYTTNGKPVTARSPIYSGPFTLTQSTTVQARAFLGASQSYTSVIVYTMN